MMSLLNEWRGNQFFIPPVTLPVWPWSVAGQGTPAPLGLLNAPPLLPRPFFQDYMPSAGVGDGSGNPDPRGGYSEPRADWSLSPSYQQAQRDLASVSMPGRAVGGIVGGGLGLLGTPFGVGAVPAGLGGLYDRSQLNAALRGWNVPEISWPQTLETLNPFGPTLRDQAAQNLTIGRTAAAMAAQAVPVEERSTGMRAPGPPLGGYATPVEFGQEYGGPSDFGPSFAESMAAAGYSDPGAAEGFSYRRGGPIPNRGSPRRDPVPIVAHEGEFVIRPEMAAQYRGMLEAMNAGMLNRHMMRGRMR